MIYQKKDFDTLDLERMALNIAKANIEIALGQGDYLRVRSYASNAIEIEKRITLLEAVKHNSHGVYA